MVVDINAYVGHWPFTQLQYNNCSKLLARMDRFGVDISVISNLNGVFYKNTQSANEELFAELNSERAYSSRLIPFAVINPIYAGWKHDLDTCVTRFGMKGVRLYPQYHDYGINDPSLIELVKKARDYGIAVAFDIRMVDSRQRSWLDIPRLDLNAKEKRDVIFYEWALANIIPIIREVPDAKYIVVNLANSLSLDEADLALVRKTDILFDTSGRALDEEDSLGLLIKRFGSDKFAFGSHAPILDYLTGRLRIESMSTAEADEQTRELLRSGNARRILGI